LKAKPQIAALPNGPYRLSAADGTNLQRQSGAHYSMVGAVALCRCGGSKNKPFCDGTHSSNGFSSANTADGALDKRQIYSGTRITIFDNRAICAHAGICTDRLKSVFRYGGEPCIDPNGASIEQVIDTIRQCPSGALSYDIDGVQPAPPAREPMVTVTDNGPYAITGGVELMSVEFGDGASKEHYTLCRCGASKNKPFCDGSHWAVGFKDP
jgi:CDGSH-type Zn-finger protein/ferredoxin